MPDCDDLDKQWDVLIALYLPADNSQVFVMLSYISIRAILVCFLGFNIALTSEVISPGCSSDTLTNVLQDWNAMPQTQDMTPDPAYSHYTDAEHDMPPRHRHRASWLVVFYVPCIKESKVSATARSFRDDTPIYCPLRRT